MKTKFEHKDGSGSLFVNDKGDNPARADYTGSFKLGGVVYRVAAWKKQAKSGNVYLSLALDVPKPKEEAPPAAGGDDFPF